MRKIKDKIAELIDPHHQSFLFFHWNTTGIVVVIAVSIYLTLIWKGVLMHALLNNMFVYLPNYVTHEMLGHNLVGGIFYRALYSSYPEVGRWILTLAGNGVETLLPLCLVFAALRLQGGRWLMPPLMYWLSTTFYGAGEYAQDARACTLPLTSSDMITTHKAGEVCGDWNHILGPIGLLDYDQWVAYTFLFIGSLLFVITLYSLWYYWTHSDQYTYIPPARDPLHLDDDNWEPPNIYTPQQEKPGE